jgi:general stress protein 26
MVPTNSGLGEEVVPNSNIKIDFEIRWSRGSPFLNSWFRGKSFPSLIVIQINPINGA